MTPMLVFDGDCGFCTRCAAWVRRRARGVRISPWQALDLDEVGLTEGQVRAAAYWVEGGRKEGGERAVARALMACGPGYRVLGHVLLLPGVRRVSAVGYRFVAQHRGRLPGPRSS